MSERDAHLKVTKECVHGTLPPCSCACAANLDIRELMKKVSFGNFNGAYRMLATQLIFPNIATTLCGKSCFQECAENIDIHAIEQTCISAASDKTPPKYSVTQKDKKVAIVGAGVSGLSCALRLSERGYPVVVFDKKEEIGGRLFERMDREEALQEVTLQFRNAPYTFEGGREVKDLQELSAFDVIFVATGKDGDTFGLDCEAVNEKSMATKHPGVFSGGELLGADPFKALVQGKVASMSMEKYLLQEGNMEGNPDSFLQEVCLFEVTKSDAVPLLHDGKYARADAKAEAKRCRQCDCTLCIDHCHLMKQYKTYPVEMERLIHAATHPGGYDQVRSRMILSCNACGYCGSVCPKGISMEAPLTKAKETLRSIQKFPPTLHAWYLRDMRRVREKYGFVHLPEGTESLNYLIFPGCQAASVIPEEVALAYAWLRDKDGKSGLFEGCCGAPALWSGDTALMEETLSHIKKIWEESGCPTLVLLCANCAKIIRDHLPELPWSSFYELYAQSAELSGAERNGTQMAVFDPCASREFDNMQASVRTILQQSGVPLTELSPGGEQTLCCGNGGQVHVTNPGVADDFLNDAANLSGLPYVTYCAGCLNRFLSVGKECHHILEILFTGKQTRHPVHLSQGTDNRKKLFDMFMEPENKTDKTMQEANIKISEELYRKMDRNLISEEEVIGIVSEAAKSGNYLKKEGSDICFASGQFDFATVWVAFRQEAEDCYEVCSVYQHRIHITV